MPEWVEGRVNRKCERRELSLSLWRMTGPKPQVDESKRQPKIKVKPPLAAEHELPRGVLMC